MDTGTCTRFCFDLGACLRVLNNVINYQTRYSQLLHILALPWAGPYTYVHVFVFTFDLKDGLRLSK